MTIAEGVFIGLGIVAACFVTGAIEAHLEQRRREKQRSEWGRQQTDRASEDYTDEEAGGVGRGGAYT